MRHNLFNLGVFTLCTTAAGGTIGGIFGVTTGFFDACNAVRGENNFASSLEVFYKTWLLSTAYGVGMGVPHISYPAARLFEYCNQRFIENEAICITPHERRGGH